MHRLSRDPPGHSGGGGAAILYGVAVMESPRRPSATTSPAARIPVLGVLEIMDNGHGFLRLDRHWMPGPDDIYVSQTQIRRGGAAHGRPGDGADPAGWAGGVAEGAGRRPRGEESFHGSSA